MANDTDIRYGGRCLFLTHSAEGVGQIKHKKKKLKEKKPLGRTVGAATSEVD